MSQTKMINTRVTDENSVVRSSIPLQVLCHIHRPIVFLVKKSNKIINNFIFHSFVFF